MLEMRKLDPEIDLELFHTAYNWRPERKKHVGANQMPFDDFLNSWAVLGLFNGEFVAAYVVKEYQKGFFDLHFTSKRKTPRDYLVAGGIQITNWLIENGAWEVSALIISRNHALRKFLEDCGYKPKGILTFTGSPQEWVKYVAV